MTCVQHVLDTACDNVKDGGTCDIDIVVNDLVLRDRVFGEPATAEEIAVLAREYDRRTKPTTTATAAMVATTTTSVVDVVKKTDAADAKLIAADDVVSDVTDAAIVVEPTTETKATTISVRYTGAPGSDVTLVACPGDLSVGKGEVVKLGVAV